MIESSPQLNYDLMTKAVPLMDKPEIRGLVDEINEKYLYWSDVKYKRVADGSGDIAPTELWACVKFSRMLQRLTVWKKYGISFFLTNSMQRLCHCFDISLTKVKNNTSYHR